MRTFSLQYIMLTLFLLLTVPVLAGVIAFGYTTSERITRVDSIQRIDHHQEIVSSSIENLFREVAANVQSMATAGNLQPDLFQGKASIDYLSTVARGTPDVQSAYVGLEDDGTFYQGRYMLFGQSVHGKAIPQGTVFAHRWVVPKGNAGRVETYEFLDHNMNVLGTSVASSDYDPRQRPWYQITKAAKDLTISDPNLFATLSLVGFTIAAPIKRDGDITGVVAIDLTLEGLSNYLSQSRISNSSMSFVLDHRGNVIANSKVKDVYQISNGTLQLSHITEWPDPVAGIVYSQRTIGVQGPQDLFVEHGGKEYAASLEPISAAHGKAWQVFTIAPVTDFSGAIEQNNRRVLLIGIIATILQIAIIWIFARKLATPLEQLVRQVDRIRNLNQDDEPDLPDSRIMEIGMLTKAVETLDNAIRSFASFVPVGLVRELLQSEQKLEIGGNSRFLTVFFSDMEGFTDLSEKIPAKNLVERVSDYLNIVANAVNLEAGTIDKFIGDGVMAFWGAPNLLEDHARRACMAALRVQAKVSAFNQAHLAETGESLLNVRIGIHSDAVVVGNIGSPERMSYTVLGDGVNVAARLEQVNKLYGTNICISHSVYKETGDILCVRPIGDIRFEGRRASTTVYELMGAFGHGLEFEPDAATLELANLSRIAFHERLSGNVEAAIRVYTQITQEFPDDPVARAILSELTTS